MASYNPVYSQPFIEWTDSTPNLLYEVPAGFTAIVADVEFWDEVGAAAMSMTSVPPGADQGIVFAYLEAAGLLGSKLWQGRVVLLEGYTLQLNTDAFGVATTVYAGGYLLRNTLT